MENTSVVVTDADWHRALICAKIQVSKRSGWVRHKYSWDLVSELTILQIKALQAEKPLTPRIVRLRIVDQEADDLCWACDASDLKWKRGRKNGIECRWYWDGDGTLAFGLPDGRWLVNTDCKKSHGWYLVDSLEEI